MYLADLVNMLAGLPPLMEVLAVDEGGNNWYLWPPVIDDRFQPPLLIIGLASRQPVVNDKVIGWVFTSDNGWQRDYAIENPDRGDQSVRVIPPDPS